MDQSSASYSYSLIYTRAPSTRSRQDAHVCGKGHFSSLFSRRSGRPHPSDCRRCLGDCGSHRNNCQSQKNTQPETRRCGRFAVSLMTSLQPTPLHFLIPLHHFSQLKISVAARHAEMTQIAVDGNGATTTVDTYFVFWWPCTTQHHSSNIQRGTCSTVRNTCPNRTLIPDCGRAPRCYKPGVCIV